MAPPRFLSTPGRGVALATRDAGTDEWQVERALQDVTVSALATDGKTTAFAGARNGEGVFRSRDGGHAWTPSGLAGRRIRALAVSPADPARVFAGVKPAGLFISRDGGDSWEESAGFRRIPSRRFWASPAEADPRGYVQTVACAPTDPDHILVGIEVGGVLSTRDGGRTWKRERPGTIFDCHTLAAHPSRPGCFYEAGAGFGAAASAVMDGADGWARARTGLSYSYGWAVTAHPADPTVTYFSAAPGPGRAHGNGDARARIYRWRVGERPEPLGGGLPDPLPSMPYALVTHAGEPDAVYAGMANGEVWKGTARGNAWERLPLDLGRVERAMLLLP